MKDMRNSLGDAAAWGLYYLSEALIRSMYPGAMLYCFLRETSFRLQTWGKGTRGPWTEDHPYNMHGYADDKDKND